MKTAYLVACGIAAALAAAPAVAQNTTAPGNGGSPTVGTTSAGTTSAGTPSSDSAPATGSSGGVSGLLSGGGAEHNPVLADNGDVRGSKVIGSSVYGDKNDKLGSVDEILITKDGKADQAVISVGGVLGVGGKLVAVPYSKLKFADTLDNNNARVMMPGTTADSLNGLPTFHYASK